MAIPATIQTDVKYTSDGKAVFWPIPFPYNSFADVGVKVIDSTTGVETVLTLGQDYQIQGDHVVAVVPQGKQLQIWLTTALDTVLAQLPGAFSPDQLPGPGRRGFFSPSRPIPGPGQAVSPPSQPIPPLGNPWADRHLGVLAADVQNLRRQLEEGLAIERARETDGQVQRLRDEGKRQKECVVQQTSTSLQASLSTLATTTQSHTDNLNAIGLGLTTTANQVAAQACEKQRAAQATITTLDQKITEVKTDLAASEFHANAAMASATEAKQYRNEAVAAASDAIVAKDASSQYQAQVAADRQIVVAAQAAVAADKAVCTAVQTEVRTAKTAVEAAQAHVESRIAAGEAAAETATTAAAQAASSATRAGSYASSADVSAQAAQAAVTDVTAMQREVAADREVAREARTTAVASATTATNQATRATSAASEAVAADTSARAARDAAQTARDTAQAAASTATIQAANAASAAQAAANSQNAAAQSAASAKADADRAEAVVPALEAKIAAEAQAREAADTALEERLSADELSTSAQIADMSNASLLQGERLSRVETALSEETACRQRADLALAADLAAEVQARETADAAEAHARETADAREAQARENADAQEAATREAEIQRLDDSITSNQLSSSAQMADISNASLLQGQRLSRVETALKADISAEAHARETADAREAQARESADAQEAATREAEIQRLDDSITANELSASAQMADMSNASLLQGNRLSKAEAAIEDEAAARIDADDREVIARVLGDQEAADATTALQISVAQQLARLSLASLMQTARINNAVTTVTMIHDAASGDTTVINEGEDIPDDIGDGDLLVVHANG